MEMSAKFLQARNCFNRVLDNVRIISVQNGLLKAEFKVTKDCVNEEQKAHNGFSATVVDVLTSVGLISLYNRPVNFVSINMHFRFLQAAHLGDEVLVETKTLKKGKSLCFLEAELRNKTTNNLLVKAGQIVYVLSS